MTKLNTIIPVDEDAVVLDHVTAMPSKSAQIRFLASLGWKNSVIAKYLTAIYYDPKKTDKVVRYQHVRNVLNQKLAGE